MGFRPLVLGRLKGSWVLAERDHRARPHRGGVRPRGRAGRDRRHRRRAGCAASGSSRRSRRARLGRCVFEHIYFARPDSVLFGKSVYEVRHAIGQRLAEEHPVAGGPRHPGAGLGRARGDRLRRARAGSRSRWGSSARHYVGRTFIEPQQSIRHFGVKLKLNAVRGVLDGKRVVVVDDSIVRGTTSRKIVKMIRGGRRERRSTSASARRPPPGPATTASTRPRGRSSSRRTPHGRGDRDVRHGGLARLPLARRALRRGRRASARASATPASRASTSSQFPHRARRGAAARRRRVSPPGR